MTTPRFSIIIPAYNVADFIETCISSVLQQSFSDFELLIVEDCSTDPTLKIAKQLIAGEPRAKIIKHKTNRGLSAARNSGIAKAKGEYLILLDGDDFLTAGALQIINDALAPDLDLLRFQAQDFYEDGHSVVHREIPIPTTSGPEAWATLATYHYIEPAPLYAYRTEFFKQHHFTYAEGCVAEDFGLTPLIIAHAVTFKSIPDICYNYRQRAGSITHSQQKLKTRVVDSFVQLQNILPRLSSIRGTKPIAHYLVASYLTLAAQLPYDLFERYYLRAKDSHFLAHLHAPSAKSLPRTLLAKYAPKLFYKCYNK